MDTLNLLRDKKKSTAAASQRADNTPTATTATTTTIGSDGTPVNPSTNPQTGNQETAGNAVGGGGDGSFAVPATPSAPGGGDRAPEEVQARDFAHGRGRFAYGTRSAEEALRRSGATVGGDKKTRGEGEGDEGRDVKEKQGGEGGGDEEKEKGMEKGVGEEPGCACKGRAHGHGHGSKLRDLVHDVMGGSVHEDDDGGEGDGVEKEKRKLKAEGKRKGKKDVDDMERSVYSQQD
ncbi:hypothetical protein F4775DRAFT_607933 [Biscogniauxia sp. FL1348]|nr:hypothetical protein F4775DRAFT_607933 [Biscogniauxia sp. FL1348]